MPIATCLLNLDRNQRELSPHGTVDFPCAGYDEIYSLKTESEFPWHWHEEIELLFIASGCMTVQVPGKTFVMHSGDSVFVNSGILHYGKVNRQCKLHSIVFSPLLISGTKNSAIDKKYVQPLIHYAPLDGLLCVKNGSDSEITACISTAFNSLQSDCPGEELVVRDSLSHLWFLLYEKFKDDIQLQNDTQNRDAIRLRIMMTYIHEHFAEPVTLTQIASSAAVGERECLRCFKRSIQISPVQYLIMHRLHQSALLLRENKSDDIASVALNCGFASPGSFTQLFERYYQCTPREYRKKI